MKILFLVHVQEMFREHFPDRMYVPRLVRALESYDKVYCFNFEDPAIWELESHCWAPQQVEWGWGYEPDMFGLDEDGNRDGEDEWVIPTSSPHEWTWVHPILRDKDEWNRHVISVGGGCESECLQDFKDVLEFVGINHRVVQGYVY